ncbi:rod shape-determining protein RodA [Faecalicatena orotica]|uniref:Rod shape determining protein RodA n=1 Tax=Faecalicatena orotica TaxID=1544 RepID=A0A2Y9BBM3_9FIRM|nr:FtsW/RodA/SpoVE family cell cycle protein [Faecalicatena orotica]PWJ30745.1 rod shape determining protein RodA [Faecalicatena orotica]SSA54906.1 rod shape determining protein RodA [Faecalicatena orotica]
MKLQLKLHFLNIKQRYHLRDYKFSLVALVTAISIIGIFVVGSAQASVQGKQALGVILGTIAMVVISLIDYKWVMNWYWPLYGLNIVLLLAVHFFGEEVNGATRWLNLGFVQFQPSDLTKIIMILFYAKFYMDREQAINNKKTIIQAVALLLPSLILIYKQPNLSNTICLAILFCIILFLAGLSYKFIGTVLAIVIPTAALFLSIVVQPNQPFLKDYQQKRILAWLEPEKYATDEAYQQINSVMAIGSGQLTGKGYNSNTTTSVKNGNFISEPQTDFIFAIIGEELGFVGCCVVIILLLLIVIECILIGVKAKDTGGRLICGGVATLIGVQTFINISVATQIFPNTGISLPFVSYGMTSVVCFYMGIGFVLNVGLQPNKYQ